MTYYTEARARAKRRKSPWNLLLIPAVATPWLLLMSLSTITFATLYRLAHPASEFVILPDTVGGILMAVGPLFAWLSPAMILGNLLVSLLPPARRALDAEAASAPRAGRVAANRDLLKLSFILTPAGLALGLLGVLF